MIGSLLDVAARKAVVMSLICTFGCKMVGCTIASVVVVDDTRSRELGTCYIPTFAVLVWTARHEDNKVGLNLQTQYEDGDDHGEAMVGVRLFRNRRTDLWPTLTIVLGG